MSRLWRIDQLRSLAASRTAPKTSWSGSLQPVCVDSWSSSNSSRQLPNNAIFKTIRKAQWIAEPRTKNAPVACAVNRLFWWVLIAYQSQRMIVKHTVPAASYRQLLIRHDLFMKRYEASRGHGRGLAFVMRPGKTLSRNHHVPYWVGASAANLRKQNVSLVS